MENNSINTNQQPLEPPKKSFRFSKTFVILMILFLLAIVGVGGYMLGANQNQIAQIQPQPAIPTTEPFPTPTIDPSAGTSVTPAPVTYKPGSNWHTVNNATRGLTFCLPPKWDFSKNGDGSLSGELIFYRDAGYAPTVASIENISYSGGSRREAYFKHWEGEFPSLREIVSIKETNINGNIVLTIYPVSESKSPPDGLTVVWYTNGKLSKASLSDWRSVNQSQTAFLKDFYTAISCSL